MTGVTIPEQIDEDYDTALLGGKITIEIKDYVLGKNTVKKLLALSGDELHTALRNEVAQAIRAYIDMTCVLPSASRPHAILNGEAHTEGIILGYKNKDLTIPLIKHTEDTGISTYLTSEMREQIDEAKNKFTATRLETALNGLDLEIQF